MSQHNFRWNRKASLEILEPQVFKSFEEGFQWLMTVFIVHMISPVSVFTSVSSSGANHHLALWLWKNKCFLRVWFSDKYQLCCLWRETLRSCTLCSYIPSVIHTRPQYLNRTTSAWVAQPPQTLRMLLSLEEYLQQIPTRKTRHETVNENKLLNIQHMFCVNLTIV